MGMFAHPSGRKFARRARKQSLCLEPLEPRVLLDASFPGQLIDVADTPYAATAADLNLDGHPDLAVTKAATSVYAMSVLLGNGDGSFQDEQQYGLPLSVQPQSIISADFNEDGKPDLAMASFNLAVVFLGNGDGTLQDYVEYAVGVDPVGVCVGDFDDDGHVDLATNNKADDTVSVLLGNGDGTFQAQQAFAVGDNPWWGIAASDLDGDGDSDIVTANSFGDSLSVLLSNGDGTFAAQQEYAVGNSPCAVSVADLNEDGEPDLVAFASTGQLSISVLLGNGDGTFQDAVGVGVSDTHNAGCVFDADGDGHVDLVAKATYIIYVYRGLGDGTFEDPGLYALGCCHYAVTYADVDGDGALDIVTPVASRDAVMVFRGRGDGTFRPQSFNVGDDAVALADADFDRDGNLDVVALRSSPSDGEVLFGDGSGGLASPVTYDIPTGARSVVALDLDGEDGPDIAMANRSYDNVAVMWNQGDGTFGAIENFAVGDGPYDLVAADFDNDTFTDIATVNYNDDSLSVLLSNGDGTFQTHVDSPASNGPSTLAAADVDGDHLVDVVAAHQYGDAIGVYLGNGDGTFADGGLFAAGDYPKDVALGDVNGDGRIDAVTANSASRDVTVLLGNGDGTFGAPVSYGTVYGASAVVVRDLDGDGHVDLAATSEGWDIVVVFLGAGDGTFGPPIRLGGCDEPNALIAADFDGDGRPDLSALNSTSSRGTVTLFASYVRWRSWIDTPIRSGDIVEGDTLRFAGGGEAAAGVASFHWEFGDQRTSIVEDPGLVTFPTVGDKTVTCAVVDVNGATDTSPATRAIRVVPDTGSHPDLVVTRFDVPEDLAIAQATQIPYTVANQGDGALPAASWGDAIYLSTDAWLDGDDLLLGRADVSSQGLAVGETYAGSIEVFIPLDQPDGAYCLILSIDDAWEVLERRQLNNERAADIDVLIPLLTPGVPYQATFTPASRSHYYRVEVHPGEYLSFELDDADDQGINELYFDYYELPSVWSYDAKSPMTAEADVTVGLTSTIPGTWFVRVENVMQTGGYTLTAQAEALALDDVNPKIYVDLVPIHMILDGAGFVPGTRVELVAGDGTTYSAPDVDVVSLRRIEAEFPMDSIPHGIYLVRVSTPAGATAELADICEFTPTSPYVTVLDYDLALPSVVGYHAVATIYEECTNAGESAIRAPLLFLEAEQEGRKAALLTLDEAGLARGHWTSALPEGFSNSIQVLASGDVPGWLMAGESVRVPVYYAGWQIPWDMKYPPIEWTLTTVTADSVEPLDWAQHKDPMQPEWIGDEAWEPVWANLLTQAGDTWGEYVTLLGDNAYHLSRVGQEAVDVGELLAFELMQADGLSPLESLGAILDAHVVAPGLALSFTRVFGASISDRYEVGPFGRGWSHNWQPTLEVAPDGTVSIHEPGRQPRIFQPDRRGGYLASPGDYSTLEAAGGGAFTLTDIRGMVVAYRPDGNVDYMGDTNGNRITASYANGLLTRLDHSSGQWLELAYNAADFIERLTDSEGGEATFTYDAGNEHLLSVSYDDGRAIHYTYSSGQGAAREHALTGILQACACGGNQYFTYDPEGRLASTHREGGAELVTFAYDAAGTVSATDAAGHTTQYLFDTAGRPARIIDANGNSVTSGYSDLHGRTTAMTDPLGRAYTYGHDQTARLVSVTDPLGKITEYTYTDSPDRLASVTDANGNGIEYSYDARGNLLAMRYEDNTVESYTYDAVGNVDTWTNRRGQTVDYDYDAAGRVTAKIYPDSSRIDYTYDAHGNLTTATDAAGTTVLEYDADDRLSRITYPDGEWIQFTHTATGQRASVADSLGGQVQYSYEALGRLGGLTDGDGNPIAQYTYDAAGRLERKGLGSGVYTTYEYDPAGQLLHLINYAPDDSVLSRFDYVYDVLGQCTSMTTLDGEWTYEYDYLGQLTHAVFDSANGAIPDQDLSYQYDPLGNRIRTVAGGQTVDYTTNDMNQYEAAGDTTYQYDDDGNLTQKISPAGTTTYTYDIENRLVRVETATDTWEYVYDALGSRVATIHNGAETNCLVDPTRLDTVLAEYDAAGDLLTAYRHAYSSLVARTDDAGNAQYYTFEAIGNAAELTDAAGNVVNDYAFGPFGLPLRASEAVPNDFEFLGQWGIQATGHGDSFVRARYYDAALGRFLAEDPLGIRGGDANLSKYAFNDPVNQVDVSGRDFLDLTGHDWEDLMDRMWHEFDQFLGSPPAWTCQMVCGYVESGPQDVWDYLEETSTMVSHMVGEVFEPDEVDWTRSACRMMCGPPSDPPSPPSPPSPPAPPDGGGSRLNKPSGSKDPNQKLGPAGFGEAHYVPEGQLLGYRIDFENDPTAGAPAQYVTVTDQLDGDLDWTTFELTEAGFGDHLFAIPAGTRHYHNVVPMTYNDTDFELHIQIGFDVETGQIDARFLSLDPATGLPPTVDIGFLPPEDGTGRGQGHFSYVIEHDPGLPTGTEIRNIAVIQFDFGEIIATNQVDPHDPGQGTDPAKEALVTLDADLPESQVAALAATTAGPEFWVEWTGQDGTSGVGSYDVYVSTDGGAWELWLDATDATAAFYPGEVGRTYAFYSTATDHVGHAEAAPGEADTETTVTTAFAAPAGLTIDMQVMSAGQLNITGPAPKSLQIVSLDPGSNPPSALFAVQVGDEPDAGWLRFVDAGGRTDVFADGTEPEWHAAAEWADKRLRGLQPDTACVFHVRAGDGLGGASAAADAGPHSTNADCDVNRSGLATALDYAYIKKAILGGMTIGVDQSWACDVTGDARVNTLDLAAARFRILNPLAAGNAAMDQPETPAARVEAISTSAAAHMSGGPAGHLDYADTWNAIVNGDGAVNVLDLSAARFRSLSLVQPPADGNGVLVAAPDQLAVAYAQWLSAGRQYSLFDRDQDGDVDRADITGSHGAHFDGAV